MSSSDRPSRPNPVVTPENGFFRPGLVYVDDSATARQTMRRALYAHAMLLEAYESIDALRARRDTRPIRAALLDVDLGGGVTGLDVAREILASNPAVHIAFITAGGSAERRAQLAPHGPMFDKARELRDAVDWLVSFATEPASNTGETG